MNSVLLLFVAVLAALGGLALIRLFVIWERQGKSAQIVVGILAFTIVDSCLWSDQAAVPSGLFHPGVFRVPEVLIACALIARLWVRGVPRRIGATSFVLLLWVVWWVTASVVGVINHYDFTNNLYQLKAAIYVGGGYALAAGAPVAGYLKSRAFPRLIVWSAVAATVMALLTESGALVSLSIPTMETPRLGELGADTASLFVALGLLAITWAAVKRERSWSLVVAAIPLLLSAAVAEQRAALVGLAVSVVVLLVAAVLPPSKLRFRTTSTEVGIVLASLVAVLVLIVVTPVATSGTQPSLPFVSDLQTKFNGVGKRDSAQQRVNQFDAAVPAIKERWLTGWGLAKTVRFYATGENKLVDTFDTHDIALDLLVRTGLVGFVLFLLVILLLFRDGISTWRRHPDNMVAMLALVSIAIVAGLLAKGTVESIFEKYRLAVALGIFMGIARSAAVSPRELADENVTSRLRHDAAPYAPGVGED